MRLYTIALFPLIEPNDDGVKESSSAIIDTARLGRSWPAILKEYDTLTLAAFAGACVTMTVKLVARYGIIILKSSIFEFWIFKNWENPGRIISPL